MAQTVLTATGFKRKYYADFIAEMEQTARQLFGSDVNLDTNSPLGKFIKLQAYARAEENELSEAVYLSDFIDHAEGVSLDRVAKRIGVSRVQAAKATGTTAKANPLQLTIAAGKTVPAGSIVATTGDVQFKTLADVTNPGAATATLPVDAEAVAAGPGGDVPANTVTVIKTPVSGFQSVNNPQPITGGRDAETDAEFRARYKKSVAKAGASTTDGITATLLATLGVRAAIVIENDTDAAFGNGQPAHSLAPVILGGTPADVGAAILASKAGGIRSWGNQTVVVKDKSGNDKTIGYSYATQKDIWVKITLSKNAAFPADGLAKARLASIQYIGGTDADNNIYTGLGMGDDVVYGQLFKAALLIPGVDDANVQVSTDGIAWTQANIAINATEVAQTDAAKVTVE